LTNQAAKEQAQKLGYGQEVRDPPFNSHGNKVFTNGKNFITADRDVHSGGAWKMFDSSGTRLGTYDINLNRIGN
jgi:filamentous hemagglutinin